jgi:hypothetical protein
VCRVAVQRQVDEFDAELARQLRGRSPTANAGVVVDGDAVTEGEIDGHRDTRIVAKGVTTDGAQSGPVGRASVVSPNAQANEGVAVGVCPRGTRELTFRTLKEPLVPEPSAGARASPWGDRHKGDPLHVGAPTRRPRRSVSREGVSSNERDQLWELDGRRWCIQADPFIAREGRRRAVGARGRGGSQHSHLLRSAAQPDKGNLRRPYVR